MQLVGQSWVAVLFVVFETFGLVKVEFNVQFVNEQLDPLQFLIVQLDNPHEGAYEHVEH